MRAPAPSPKRPFITTCLFISLLAVYTVELYIGNTDAARGADDAASSIAPGAPANDLHKKFFFLMGALVFPNVFPECLGVCVSVARAACELYLLRSLCAAMSVAMRFHIIKVFIMLILVVTWLPNTYANRVVSYLFQENYVKLSVHSTQPVPICRTIVQIERGAFHSLRPRRSCSRRALRCFNRLKEGRVKLPRQYLRGYMFNNMSVMVLFVWCVLCSALSGGRCVPLPFGAVWEAPVATTNYAPLPNEHWVGGRGGSVYRTVEASFTKDVMKLHVEICSELRPNARADFPDDMWWAGYNQRNRNLQHHNDPVMNELGQKLFSLAEGVAETWFPNNPDYMKAGALPLSQDNSHTRSKVAVFASNGYSHCSSVFKANAHSFVRASGNRRRTYGYTSAKRRWEMVLAGGLWLSWWVCSSVVAYVFGVVAWQQILLNVGLVLGFGCLLVPFDAENNDRYNYHKVGLGHHDDSDADLTILFLHQDPAPFYAEAYFVQIIGGVVHVKRFSSDCVILFDARHGFHGTFPPLIPDRALFDWHGFAAVLKR